MEKDQLKRVCRRPLLGGLLLLAACGSLPGPRGESPHIYVLEAQQPVPAAQIRRDLVLAVSMPQARPGFDTQRMAYMREPHELEYFATHQWADTPSRMLAPLLAQALEQSGGFRAVVRTPATVSADIRLDTELVHLQQDFRVHPSRVSLKLHIQLVDLRNKRVLAAREFDATEEAPADTPNDGVIAANRAVQRMLQQVSEFCLKEPATP